LNCSRAFFNKIFCPFASLLDDASKKSRATKSNSSSVPGKPNQRFVWCEIKRLRSSSDLSPA